MFDNLSLPYRRALALAILAVLVVSAWDFLVSPVAQALGAQSTHIEALEMRYSRLKSVIDEGKQLAGMEDDWDPDTLRGHQVLSPRSPTIAAGELQGRVKTVASTHNINVTRLNNLEPRNKGILQRIGVRVTMDASSEGLAAFLKALEEGAPSLFVSALEVESYDRSSQPPAKSTNRLKVTLDVFGYLWGSG